MKPTEYLHELMTFIRWDRREEFDEFISVVNAFYQIEVLTDQEFWYCFDYLVDVLGNLGITRECVEEMFTSMPVTRGGGAD